MHQKKIKIEPSKKLLFQNAETKVIGIFFELYLQIQISLMSAHNVLISVVDITYSY